MSGSLAADREYGESCDRCGGRRRRASRAFSPTRRSRVRTGALRRVLRRFEPAPMRSALCMPGRAFWPLKLRAFIDFATPRLKARIAQD